MESGKRKNIYKNFIFNMNQKIFQTLVNNKSNKLTWSYRNYDWIRYLGNLFLLIGIYITYTVPTSSYPISMSSSPLSRLPISTHCLLLT